MSLLLLLHVAAAIVAPLLTRLLGRRAFLILALIPAYAFSWLVAQAGTILDGGAIEETLRWVPTLEMDLAFRISTLQWILALLVTGVGALVLAYCAWYFRPDDTTIWRFSAVFVMFAGAMLGLVMSDNLLLMYVFWELTTVFSYLLVGHNPVRAANRRSAMQALLVTTFGGLAMLAGIVVIGKQSSYLISEILIAPPEPSWLITSAVLLLLVGALTKSAQVPFHFWLPGAMAAPTPVSAYLHAAAMVKAGIYLVAVLAPVFATTPGWQPITVGLGLFTMLVGGWRALRQTDIKLLLAYGTVSQLGFLTAMAGIGTQASALAAVALVISHALFKSALFLTVGIVDRTTGTRNLNKLTGLARRLPVPFIVACVAGASMAGFPPLAGFVAKESGLNAALQTAEVLGGPASIITLVGLVIGSSLTVAYTARFIWGAFGTKPIDEEPTVARPPIGFQAAPVILTAGSLIVGLVGAFETRLIAPYYETMGSGQAPVTLGLWHGWTPELALSVTAMVLGLAMFFWRERVALAQAKVPAAVDGERSYNAFMRFVDRGAVEITAITQRGSLPIYLATILLVVVAFPGVVALINLDLSKVILWDTPAQGAIALMIIIATLVGVASRHRLRATILIGVSGMGAGLLFLVHGAPDLAITQIAVETVTIVIFVLVLRRLPSRFRTRPLNISRYWRAALATAVGVAVAAIVIVTSSARVTTPISVDMPQAAYDFGDGKNVVNVILVDIRAWDTFGEVSVLVVAATGIASLIFVRTRNTKITRLQLDQFTEDVPAVVRSWLPAARAARPERRSVIFEVITRLLFHAMVALSLYLLFVGHNMPGGGFAGGLVAGLALLVRYLAGGRYELDEAAPIDAGLLLGMGLFIAIVTAVVPMAVGGALFESAAAEFWMPVWGDVKIASALAFDVGVYLIVIGLMLDIGRSLGAGIDRQIEDEESARAEAEVATT